MKKVLFSLMLLFVATATNTVSAQDVVMKQDGAKLEFEKDVHDYGTIDQGENGECTFIITNTGNAVSSSPMNIVSSFDAWLNRQAGALP